MKPIFLYSLLIALIGLSVFETPAYAEKVCKVTDPTGTALNVRERPNGKVINALKNGREVDILEATVDDKQRPWVKVGSYYKGKYRIWGWVFREFISCYNR